MVIITEYQVLATAALLIKARTLSTTTTLWFTVAAFKTLVATTTHTQLGRQLTSITVATSTAIVTHALVHTLDLAAAVAVVISTAGN